MSRIAEDRKWRCRDCSAESLEQIKGSAGTPEQIWGIAKAALAKHKGDK